MMKAFILSGQTGKRREAKPAPNNASLLQTWNLIIPVMKYKAIFLLVLLSISSQIMLGQTPVDSTAIHKEYSNLEEALKNPEKVFRLNLSNQNVLIAKDAWSKFTNLEFLSLRNDHLKEIPQEIGLLKNLKVLDLNGNDFERLPASFSELSNLEELFLSDEKNINLNENMKIIILLPHLKVLHLENDNLDGLPKNIYRLNHLESLYLNNNRFDEVPKEIKGLKNLKYLDLHDNRFTPEQLQDIQNKNTGIKIRF